jgi:alkylated DNA repair dioxygenase AlkB
VYADIEPFLIADICKMFGKVHANKGRLVGAFTDDDGLREEKYRYGGKVLHLNPVTPLLGIVMGKISKETGLRFNWAHVVIYPTAECGLGWHADDEKAIAPGSAIAGISLFQRITDVRMVEFRPKKTV